MSKKFHQAFGVYGIISHHNCLVVIKKNGGPYINRYDLPGGSLEDGEPLQNAIVREIKEETGLVPTQLKQLGVTSFRFPWQYQRWNYNQHICVFYEITNFNGKTSSQVTQFIGQDSLGALKIPLADLNINNASPLVLKAKDFLEHDKIFDSGDWTYDEWDILDRPVFGKKS